MSYGNYEFEVFSSKEGFNRSLSHFQAVSDVLGDLEDYDNLADLLSELLSEKEIDQIQLAPTIQALLVDKYGYSYDSLNLPDTISDFANLRGEIATWKAVDIVITYLHPELGFTVINPKNPAHWDQVRELKRNELVTVYSGSIRDAEKNRKLFDSALKLVIDMFLGKKPKTPDTLRKGKYVFRKNKPEPVKKTRAPAKKKTAAPRKQSSAVSAPAVKAPVKAAEPEPAPSANKRMTPFYSVPVTNELFHNGNVEAWKKSSRATRRSIPTWKSTYSTMEKKLTIFTPFSNGERSSTAVLFFSPWRVRIFRMSQNCSVT